MSDNVIKPAQFGAVKEDAALAREVDVVPVRLTEEQVKEMKLPEPQYGEETIGELLDGLAGRLDDTLTIFTADHGESFEHGVYFEHADCLYDGAIRILEPVQDQIVRIGGSHAQRELFEDTLLEAYLRAGQLGKAETALRARLDRRPSPRDLQWLTRATPSPTASPGENS